MILEEPIYKFLKKIVRLNFFWQAIKLYFLWNSYEISHSKVPPQHIGTSKTYFLSEIITAHTYCNFWRIETIIITITRITASFMLLKILDKTREFLPRFPASIEAYIRKTHGNTPFIYFFVVVNLQCWWLKLLKKCELKKNREVK